MTRGHKKDLTITPTRALINQRNYRARRVQYISDLEECIHSLEAENAQLRIDLEAVRAGQAASPQASFDPQTAQTSSEPIHHLSLALASFAHFQQLSSSQSSLPNLSNNNPNYPNYAPSTSTQIQTPQADSSSFQSHINSTTYGGNNDDTVQPTESHRDVEI